MVPTRDPVSDAEEAMRSVAVIPFDVWTLGTAVKLAGTSFAALVLNFLFIVARYGGLTALFLGAFAIFDALSSLTQARR